MADKPNNQKTRKEKYRDCLTKFKPDSQNTKILKHLIQKGKINTYEAFDLYRVTKINSRIHDLRDAGVDIETVYCGTTDSGAKKFEYRVLV